MQRVGAIPEHPQLNAANNVPVLVAQIDSAERYTLLLCQESPDNALPARYHFF